MLTITSPYVQIADLNGDPLDDGSIYIGTAGLNAETNPITVYWDAAGTQPAAQPIKTRSGVVARNGSPARVYVNAGAYSITVRDKMGRLLASELSISSSVDASGITDGTIAEVKLDSALAAKINGALQKSGGTMLADIILAGNTAQALGAVPKQQLDAGLLLVCPPGSIKPMARLAEPSGWLLIDGKTIGNAASGATARANADTWLLFEQVWAFPAGSVPIFDSAGATSARGASAAADFAAGKRLALFTPDGGAFLRMWTPGQTKDAGRAAGSEQLDALQGHEHSAYVCALTHNLDGGGLGLPTGNHAGATYGIIDKPGYGTARVAAETRGYNLAIPHYIFLGVAT